MKKIIMMLVMTVTFTVPVFSQIAVIGNKNVDLSITTNNEARDIFTLEIQKSKSGDALVVFDLKAGDTKDKFLAAIGKTSTELKKIWMKAQLSGEGKAPEALDDEAAMVTKVASTPGAVGFVSQAKASGDVKTLFIIK